MWRRGGWGGSRGGDFIATTISLCNSPEGFPPGLQDAVLDVSRDYNLGSQRHASGAFGGHEAIHVVSARCVCHRGRKAIEGLARGTAVPIRASGQQPCLCCWLAGSDHQLEALDRLHFSCVGNLCVHPLLRCLRRSTATKNSWRLSYFLCRAGFRGGIKYDLVGCALPIS